MHGCGVWHGIVDVPCLWNEREHAQDAIRIFPILNDSAIMTAVTSSVGRPDVTVVTVVRDAFRSGNDASLRQCLESVQGQVGVTLEHIVIDGASKDGTAELLRGFSAATHTFRWVSEPDDGIYAAMNKGLAQARGRYITFLNCDDYYHVGNGLQESTKALDASGADFSYAPAVILMPDGTRSTTSPHVRPDLRNLLKGMPFSHQSVLVRTELMKRLGGFSADYYRSADYAFVMNMVFAGCRAVRVDLAFVTFRIGGFSGKRPEINQAEHAAAFVNLSRKYLGRELAEGELKAYVYACVLRTFGAQALRDGWFGVESTLAPLISDKERELLALRREIDALRRSLAYRTGMFVTYPARKAWGGAKCLRQKGVKYMTKHLVGKFVRRMGMKSVKW